MSIIQSKNAAIKRVAAIFFCLTAMGIHAEIEMEGAYHAATPDLRHAEHIPGETFTFIEAGSKPIHAADTIVLYVLTAQDFAAEKYEQIFVRWWNGHTTHWIMGSWIKNIHLDAAHPFRGWPNGRNATLDLWKVEIPSLATEPGINYYAIQLKGYLGDETAERYLLAKPGGDFGHVNTLGQPWSASEEFDGRDWPIEILE